MKYVYHQRGILHPQLLGAFCYLANLIPEGCVLCGQQLYFPSQFLGLSLK